MNGELYFIQGAQPETDEPGPAAAWEKTRVVGTRTPRVDALERLSGTAVYPSDVVLPDMLYAAILRCPHAHARVRRVDTAKAATMPGVRAVISSSSPEVKGLAWPYGRSMTTALFDPHCRYEGETVAAVAAETPYQARDAARAIEVEYEALPFIADERRALDPGAAAVHEQGNRVAPPAKTERGNVEQGFAAADTVVELALRTEAELHTPMELHGCVARWDGPRLTVWESTQGVYRVQQQIAEALKLPLANVRVIGHYMGGGFGSKLQADKYNVIAAVLARMTARPVKLFVSREETILAMGNRPPSNMKIRIGARKDGTLTAIDFSCLGSGGAYPAGGVSGVDWLPRDLYLCPNVRTETTDVFINAGPARAFRAPGHPQGAWALEQAMDALAAKLNLDPVELRLKNVPAVSQAREGSPPYTTTGLRDCLVEGAKAFGWPKARRRAGDKGPIKRGIGVAAGMWQAGGGAPPSTIIVKLFADGSASLNMGASDLGTGTKTVMAMIVSEELGVPLERIQIDNADTLTTQYATPSGGSKTIPTESPAARDAALKVRRALLRLAAEELKASPDALALDGDAIVVTAEPSRRVKVTEVGGLRRRGLLVGVGTRGPNPEGKAVNPFCAQFCEVEVDTRTGELRVVRFLSANDSGRVMNRMTYDSQVIGGVTFGIGLAMTEARVLDASQTGKMLSHNWHDYKLPTALDVPPDIVSLPLDRPDNEANTSGAKGLGEPVTIPTAAAIANALHDALGVRFTDTVLNPIQIVARLSGPRKEA